MDKWEAYIVNDPENDYDLMAEILYDGNEVAMIRKINGAYSLLVYSASKDIQIPLPWLIELIDRLKQK